MTCMEKSFGFGCSTFRSFKDSLNIVDFESLTGLLESSQSCSAALLDRFAASYCI